MSAGAFINCGACGGTGKRYDTDNNYYYSPCSRCKGAGGKTIGFDKFKVRRKRTRKSA